MDNEGMDPFLRAAIEQAKAGLADGGGIPIGSVLAIDGRQHPNRHWFLSDARVGRARQHAGRKQIEQRLLEQPDAKQQ